MIITSTAHIAAKQGVKALIYGKSGIGKTTLARTVPNILVISSESGLLSLAAYNIPVVEITDAKGLTEVYNWLKSSKEANQYSTIFIDSISEVAEVILARAKVGSKDARQAYGEMLDQAIAMAKCFRDLSGKNVVMVAKQEVDGVGMPSAKLGARLPYLFDEVFRMGIDIAPDGSNYRFLQTTSDYQYEAKDRSGKLAPIEPPDLNHVFNKIKGV